MAMFGKIRLFSLLLIPATCSIVSGCGDGGPVVAPVTGFILIDDLPLTDATVTFRPESGRSSSGTTNEKGEFKLQYNAELAGALVGPHKVIVSRGNAELMGMSESQQDSAAGAAEASLPARCNSATELTAEVLNEDNFFAFTLKSAEGKSSPAAGD